MTRIHEDPRVTKPYTDAQWRDILALGDRVDTELAAGDVRLTMGGEPTFVSIDDMDGEEWNTAATGPAKRRLAGALLRRLRDSFAPGGLLHFGQGKWYPGESLPRWAFTCFWRTDGLPLWRDAALLAEDDRDYGYGVADARMFAEALAERLSVGPEHLLTAYEDPLAYVHKERQLPVNVDPEDNKLDDPEERERLRRVFSRGLGTPAGFVLPLAARRRQGRPGVAVGPVDAAGEAPLPGAGRFARRLPSAAGQPARRAVIRRLPDRSDERRRRCPIRRHHAGVVRGRGVAAAAAGPDRARRRRIERDAADPERAAGSRLPAPASGESPWSARRSRWRRATARCASSCRRWHRLPTTSI